MFPNETGWIVNPHKKRTAPMAKKYKKKRHRPSKGRPKIYYKRSKGKVLFVGNPHKRRRYAPNAKSRYRHNRRRSYRNRAMTGFLWDAAYVTGGFVGNRMLSGFILPMVPGITAWPSMRIIGKGATAWLLGWGMGMMLGRQPGNLIMVGGLVEALNDAVRTYVAPFFPALGDDMNAYPMLPMGSYPTLGNYTDPYGMVGAGEYSNADEV